MDTTFTASGKFQNRKTALLSGFSVVIGVSRVTHHAVLTGALGGNRTPNYPLGRDCYIHLTTRAKWAETYWFQPILAQFKAILKYSRPQEASLGALHQNRR